MILSYEDDEAGSRMTTNYIVIHNNLTVRQAMRELVKQAGRTTISLPCMCLMGTISSVAR